jgi:hypothetical protein
LFVIRSLYCRYEKHKHTSGQYLPMTTLPHPFIPQVSLRAWKGHTQRLTEMAKRRGISQCWTRATCSSLLIHIHGSTGHAQHRHGQQLCLSHQGCHAYAQRIGCRTTEFARADAAYEAIAIGTSDDREQTRKAAETCDCGKNAENSPARVEDIGTNLVLQY